MDPTKRAANSRSSRCEQPRIFSNNADSLKLCRRHPLIPDFISLLRAGAALAQVSAGIRAGFHPKKSNLRALLWLGVKRGVLVVC